LKKIGEIMNYGVMMTPALAIDGIVRASGQIPPGAEIVAWIAAAAGVPATAPGGSRGATALPPRPAPEQPGATAAADITAAARARSGRGP
jgi:hypothetical protein